MIKLSQGSIFDKKCDLLVIPCDDGGGVTHWVLSNLKENGLPFPPQNMSFGRVSFVDTNLKLENAEVIGFAASVEARHVYSTKESILSIGNDIYQYCKQHKLRQVNIPLLGTGAGKLSVFDSFDSLISVLDKEEDIETTFEIFIPSKDTYNTLNVEYSKILEKVKQTQIRNPRVFISYTGDDIENKKWVKELAIKLRENGVDAIIDIFHLKPGTDLPQWMTNEVMRADKVLLICESNYMKKADTRKGGAGWETMIIQGDMLLQGESRTKYIAIVREPEIDKGLPVYMRSKLVFHWKKDKKMSDEDFKSLLYAIFDCDITPELGKIPIDITKKLSKRKK